jgi:lysozyme
MTVNAETIKRLKRWEGCKLTAYQDGGGVWTIGWGHTSQAGPPKVAEGMVITQERADEIFEVDLNNFARVVERLIKVPVNDNQFGACFMLAYNIGENAFASSTLLRYLNSGDYIGAADQFGRWIHDKGKVVRGLVNRRADERELFLLPPYKDEPPKEAEPITRVAVEWFAIAVAVAGLIAIILWAM